MAFRTLNALLPTCLVYVIPYHSAPCSSPPASGLLAVFGPMLAVLPETYFPQIVRLLPSWHSGLYLKVISQILKYWPLFHHSLSLTLLYLFRALIITWHHIYFTLYSWFYIHTHSPRASNIRTVTTAWGIQLWSISILLPPLLLQLSSPDLFNPPHWSLCFWPCHPPKLPHIFPLIFSKYCFDH